MIIFPVYGLIFASLLSSWHLIPFLLLVISHYRSMQCLTWGHLPSMPVYFTLIMINQSRACPHIIRSLVAFVKALWRSLTEARGSFMWAALAQPYLSTTISRGWISSLIPQRLFYSNSSSSLYILFSQRRIMSSQSINLSNLVLMQWIFP